MNPELKNFLSRERADYVLRHHFFSAGKVGIANGFKLFRTEAREQEVEQFEITSAGIVLITLDPVGQLAVLLANEEDRRWDIPSGKVEPTDASPAHTAAREFGEETPINLAVEQLLPLSYAINPRRQGKAGVQFFAIAALEQTLLEDFRVSTDNLGRFYTSHAEINLVLEPLHIFLGSDRESLLQYSHHRWAYGLTKLALQEKIALAKEAGYGDQL